MAQDLDPLKLSSPRIFLVRMLVFVILCGLVATVLYRQIWVAFLANPGLNALILGVLVVAVRDVFRRLLDGVDPRLIDTAYEVLARQEGVESVHRVRMRWLGHRLVADAELDVDPQRSLQEAHRIAHDAEHALTHGVPKLAEATIHAYPAHSAGAVSS